MLTIYIHYFCPPPQAKQLYLEYAKLEETHGLARRAMEVYARALAHVPKEERLSVLDTYVARASDFFGVAKVRGNLRLHF